MARKNFISEDNVGESRISSNQVLDTAQDFWSVLKSYMVPDFLISKGCSSVFNGSELAILSN